MNKKPIIAIDGPAASGKGTLAKQLAQYYNLAYLDTGLLYRTVGWRAVNQGGNLANANDMREKSLHILENFVLPTSEEINHLRTEIAAKAASIVAALPEIRERLKIIQRQVAHTPPDDKNGAVLDGRDIGTIICPEADLKLFVTATPEIRAKRRFKELQSKGLKVIESTVLADIKARDEQDQARTIAPLIPAEDAIVLDTSTLDMNQMFEKAQEIIRQKKLPLVQSVG